MLSYDEAVDQLIQAGKGLHPNVGAERIPVGDALGKVLAEDISSLIDVPPQDNSAMDGYAFCFDDAMRANFVLPVSQRIPAGTAPQPLQKGTAVRIFTGAEIPEFADTVAMQEDCKFSDGVVTIKASEVQRGNNVRPKGQDIHLGAVILHRGKRIRAQEMGLLFSIGVSEVAVHQSLCVAILSTGDELVEPGQSLAPGQIYNSNRATLMGLLTAWGMDILDLGIIEDDPAVLETVLLDAAERADVIVTSGGVSVGEEDHVKPVVDALGSLEFWKIAIKPGKPLAFGQVAGTPFMGLPGNPVSTFVTACIFLRPFVFSMQGCERLLPGGSRETSLFTQSAVTRQEFIRARRSENGVEKYPNQSSGVLSSACWSDGLVVQPIGQTIDINDQVIFYPYTEFL